MPNKESEDHLSENSALSYLGSLIQWQVDRQTLDTDRMLLLLPGYMDDFFDCEGWSESEIRPTISHFWKPQNRQLTLLN